MESQKMQAGNPPAEDDGRVEGREDADYDRDFQVDAAVNGNVVTLRIADLALTDRLIEGLALTADEARRISQKLTKAALAANPGTTICLDGGINQIRHA